MAIVLPFQLELEAQRVFWRKLIELVRESGFDVPKTVQSMTVECGIQTVPTVTITVYVPVPTDVPVRSPD